MAIPLQLQLRHLVSLQASSGVRFMRAIVGSRSRNWLTESHHIKPSLLRRGLQLSGFVLLTMALIGLTQATNTLTALSAEKKQYTLGAPCTTMTDIREGTCNLKVDKIKRNAGQPKPFTNNWRN